MRRSSQSLSRGSSRSTDYDPHLYDGETHSDASPVASSANGRTSGAVHNKSYVFNKKLQNKDVYEGGRQGPPVSLSNRINDTTIAKQINLPNSSNKHLAPTNQTTAATNRWALVRAAANNKTLASKTPTEVSTNKSVNLPLFSSHNTAVDDQAKIRVTAAVNAFKRGKLTARFAVSPVVARSPVHDDASNRPNALFVPRAAWQRLRVKTRPMSPLHSVSVSKEQRINRTLKRTCSDKQKTLNRPLSRIRSLSAKSPKKYAVTLPWSNNAFRERLHSSCSKLNLAELNLQRFGEYQNTVTAPKVIRQSDESFVTAASDDIHPRSQDCLRNFHNDKTKSVDTHKINEWESDCRQQNDNRSMRPDDLSLKTNADCFNASTSVNMQVDSHDFLNYSNFNPYADAVDQIGYMDDPFEYDEERDSDEKVTVPISICLVIIFGYLMAGSALFALWEGWDYVTGSYFCFITLSTIGFGDYVPGTDMRQWAPHAKLVLCALWLAFGLSLLAMCFNLMQEEVKDKCKWIGQKLGLLKDDGPK